MAMMRRVRISLLAVDESHCISQVCRVESSFVSCRAGARIFILQRSGARVSARSILRFPASLKKWT